MGFKDHKEQLDREGYSIVPQIYTQEEVEAICELIDSANQNSPSIMQGSQVFAIRRLFDTLPGLETLIWNQRMHELLAALNATSNFLTKAIYFDKPETSNWFVAYHQDLSITVSEKAELEGYINWTNKRGQTGVQPPTDILANTITLRIHLDDTDQSNGGLRVIPGSHLKGIYRPETIDWNNEKEVPCNVPKGGIMLMTPLTLHASSRSDEPRRRRIIHLETCDKELQEPLQWAERRTIKGPVRNR